MKQREMMRELWHQFTGDKKRIVQAYADAERRGAVQRNRNAYGMSAENYATRLHRDGVAKKWIEL